VEVKGTQTVGESVIVTKNEVEIARRENSTLFLVHSIRVTLGRTPKASGGISQTFRAWAVDDCLTPNQFTLDVRKLSAPPAKIRVAKA
jgi:hypothetical protein